MIRMIATTPVTLRPATPADSDLFFRLRNDADVIATSAEGQRVTAEQHARWFAEAIAPNSAHRLWVIAADGWPVGYLRAERTSKAAVVSIALTPTARGHGIGSAALVAAAEQEPGTTWRAWIRPTNRASQRAFARAGYVRVCTAPGLLCYERAGA